MFKKINETVLKVVIVMMLCVALVILLWSAWQFYLGNISQTMLIWHASMGILVMLLTPVHMIIKKNKIKKLTEEFIDIVLRKDIKHMNNKEALLNRIKSQSLSELADGFHINLEHLLYELSSKNIKIDSEKQTLKDVAKTNAKDIYQLFVLILWIHVENSSPQEG